VRIRRPLFIAGIFLVLLFASLLVLSNTFPSLRLATVNYNLPTNPGFDPSSGSTYVHYLVKDYADKLTTGATGQSELLKLNGCSDPAAYGFCQLYGVPQGTYYAPLGMEDSNYHPCYGFLGSCSGSSLIWSVVTPSALSSGCSNYGTGTCTDSRGFDLTGTVIGQPGGYLLTSAAPAGDPTCTNYAGGTGDKNNQPSGSCWTADYSIIQAAQSSNPTGCPAGNTGYTCVFRLKSSQVLSSSAALAYLTTPAPAGPGYNSTYAQTVVSYCQNNPLATGCPIVKTTTLNWYLYRTITSLQLDVNAPTVQVQCTVVQGSCTNTHCFGCSASIDSEIRGWVQNHVLPQLNNIGLLTSTEIDFAVSVGGFVPAFSSDCVAGVATSCWWGIAAVFIGGQGIQTAGCSGTYCGSANIVQQQHTQLALYQDAGLTVSAQTSAGAILQLSQTTNQTVQSITQANTYSTVYTGINTNNLGIRYTYAGDANCNSDNVGNCINSPIPIVINVPLIYDIVGSETSYFYQYPAVPPSGGQSSGSITGTVVDASNKNLLGQYAPLVGACVAVGGPCSGYAGQIQSPTDQNGKFTLANIPAGTYSIYATAGGYNPIILTGILVSIGATTSANIAMTPTTPPGQICIIPPIPNPIPYQPPLFGGWCIPSWVIPVGIGVAVLGLGAVVFLTPAGQALGFSGAGLLASRTGRKRR
jgi:hypothetical protein